MNYLMTKFTWLALLLPAFVQAQDQASTMALLCQKADVIVRGTITGSHYPTAQLHQLTIRTDQVLKGNVSAQFVLTEPAGQCCGRSLFALTVGESRILFLKRIGPILHTTGGGRGVLAATSDLLAHLQSLLAANTTSALGHLLAANLNHAEPRIADDSALALATLPSLSLTVTERSTVIASLKNSVQRGLTRTAALADITARLSDAAAVDSIMPIYLNAAREDQARLLCNALKRCPAEIVADRLPMFVGKVRRSNMRAAKLLTNLPSITAHAAMTNLLQRPNHPQVQMQLCEGLLAAGVSAASLQPMVPEVVLKLAVERRNQRPKFRNINPQR